MNPDLGLLKFAARIVGASRSHDGEGFLIFNSQGTWSEWDPLSNDGDALRLAAAAKIRIYFDDQMVKYWAIGSGYHEHLFWGELADDEACREARHAIVRAAAAIGAAK